MNVSTAARLAAIAIASQLLLGCGNSSTSFTPTPPTTPTTASLNGNWYATGSRQARQYPFLTLALVLDGSLITANGDMMVPCSNVPTLATGGSFTLTGQLNTDGSFHLAEVSSTGVPINNSIQVAIDGSSPATGSSTWSGTYTFTDLAGYTSCIVNLTGPFTATAIAPINATYAGTLTGSLGSAVVSTTIVQGAGISLAEPGGGVDSYLPLSATITVSGSPCFTHGTASAAIDNNQINGDILSLNFIMDDGSNVWLPGWFTGPDESVMNPAGLVIGGGNCSQDGYSGTLTRQ
jgi:hypothetical protein